VGQTYSNVSSQITTRYRPGGDETIFPRDDTSSTVAYRFAADQAVVDPKIASIYVRPRTGPQSAHLWWPALTKLQAAGVPIA